MNPAPPPGFVLLSRRAPGRFVFVRAEDHEAAACLSRLDPEQSLHETAERVEGGRGSVARIALSEARRLVIKKYRRGGALSPLLPDVFLGCVRMLSDVRTSEQARREGVPCVSVAGLVLDRIGGLLWRGYLLTEAIEGAVALDRALAGTSGARAGGSEAAANRRGLSTTDRAPGQAGRSGDFPGAAGAPQLAERAVRTVRRLHDAGVLHRDLNMKNLVVAAGDVYVIDLDGATTPAEMTPALRFSNLSRLDRSYVKILGEDGPLSHEDRRRLLWTYCGGDERMRRDFEMRIDGHKRHLRRHRLSWKMQGSR